MKKIAFLATIATLAVGVTANSAQAQAQSDRRIPISKDSPTVTTTSSGDVEYTGPLGYRLRPGGASPPRAFTRVRWRSRTPAPMPGPARFHKVT